MASPRVWRGPRFASSSSQADSRGVSNDSMLADAREAGVVAVAWEQEAVPPETARNVTAVVLAVGSFVVGRALGLPLTPAPTPDRRTSI